MEIEDSHKSLMFDLGLRVLNIEGNILKRMAYHLQTAPSEEAAKRDLKLEVCTMIRLAQEMDISPDLRRRVSGIRKMYTESVYYVKELDRKPHLSRCGSSLNIQKPKQTSAFLKKPCFLMAVRNQRISEVSRGKLKGFLIFRIRNNFVCSCCGNNFDSLLS
jgi:hypothetical protein